MNEIDTVINIYSSGHQVDLASGKYQIDVLGGWGVKLRNFKVSLRYSETQEVINCKRAFWPAQSFAFETRAKRILVFEISASGKYIVEFQNLESLIVRRSNLLLHSLFQDPIPNSNIRIYILNAAQQNIGAIVRRSFNL